MNKHKTFPNRLTASLSKKALLSNYQKISNLVPDQKILAMIKANAYGHGDLWVGKTLLKHKNLYGFGLATAEEGARVRREVLKKDRHIKILIFSESTPWSDSFGQFCEKYGLTPVISNDADWKKFISSKWGHRLDYQIKFNTGMNRLGISFEKLQTVLKDCLKAKRKPEAVLTHLAMADQPHSPLSKMQFRKFKEIHSRFSSHIPGVQFHIANSSAIWNSKAWKLSSLTQIVRPGISLYGALPWKKAKPNGLKPVLTLHSKVILTRHLSYGERIGYGGQYRVTQRSGLKIAILGAGYADGILRTLSNRGLVWLGKHRSILGRVSMDLIACSCLPSTKPGDLVELLGPHIDPWQQAELAQTIPYELFTSTSISDQTRVKRKYVE